LDLGVWQRAACGRRPAIRNRMEEHLRIIVAPEEAGTRLDTFLKSRLEARSRSRVARAVREGEATVDGQVVKPAHRLSAGELVECKPLQEIPAPDDIQPEQIPLDVVYEDEYMLAVNKPPGMVTHPGVGSRSGTLVHALLGRGVHLSSGAGSYRPGIVHRLDKGTSGLLLVAKTDVVHAKLARMIAAREVKRVYECIVVGQPRSDSFRVDSAIGRHLRDRKKMAAFPPGTPGTREACTDFEVKERVPGHALLHARLHTGRTHQVRVHLSSVGLPILGDPIYGRKKAGNQGAVGSLVGQALHAFRLDLRHPVAGHPLSFAADRPPEWEVVLNALRASV
jgi:23S rRNA pseudouridine1911/1915/1917 synthase